MSPLFYHDANYFGFWGANNRTQMTQMTQIKKGAKCFPLESVLKFSGSWKLQQQWREIRLRGLDF